MTIKERIKKDILKIKTKTRITEIKIIPIKAAILER